MLQLLKRRDGTRHDDDVSVFSRCFPSVPPVDLHSRTVYNHMDAVIMCCDWDPDPPSILESDSYIFRAKLHNYITAISKLEPVWLNFTIWNCHTEDDVENWHRIPTCKRQCEWGSWFNIMSILDFSWISSLHKKGAICNNLPPVEFRIPIPLLCSIYTSMTVATVSLLAQLTVISFQAGDSCSAS